MKQNALERIVENLTLNVPGVKRLCAEGLYQLSSGVKKKIHVGFQTLVSPHWSMLQQNYPHESCSKFNALSNLINDILNFVFDLCLISI